MHYQRLPGIPGSGGPGGGGGGGGTGLSIAAIPYNTGSAPGAPWVGAGTYTVEFTVNGKALSQRIAVKLDPRVRTPSVVMQEVHTLSAASYYAAADAQVALTQLAHARDQARALQGQASGEVATALTAFAAQVDTLRGVDTTRVAGSGGGGGPGGFGGGPAFAPGSLSAAAQGLVQVMNSLQAADVPPTANQRAAIEAARQSAAQAMARWNALKRVELAALNLKLKAAGLAEVVVR